MIFLHEVHHVRGAHEDEFERLIREEWSPAVAGGGDTARLLWFFRHTHGTGPAYTAITITAVADGAAWERLARRVADGDLRAWARAADACRHDVEAKLLLALPWSPIAELDLATVPVDGGDHEGSLWMEDTGWPHAPLDEYTAFWRDRYWPLIQASADQRGRPRLLDIRGAFQVAHGAGRRPEAILMQKVVDHRALLGLLEHETAPEHKAAGTFMHDALQVRDRWESRLLRAVPWSPLH